MKPGNKAKDFTLPDQEGKMHSLADYKGKWVLLYFYPRDTTPGCTVEACAIRDAFGDFKKYGATVLGVSGDTEASHKKFAEKHSLPFPLLADTERGLIRSYGVWGKKKFMGREFMGIRRISFLIDPKGKIAKIYDPVRPAMHAEEVLQDIKSLSK